MPNRRPSSDFSDELIAHLEFEIERLRAEGLSEDEAFHQAHRNLGNLTSAGERFYESNRWMWMEHAVQDARQALRRLRKAPAFTIIRICSQCSYCRRMLVMPPPPGVRRRYRESLGKPSFTRCGRLLETLRSE